MRETLLPHEVPTRPWQTLGTDLFELEGDNYLIIVDYYSKFPFIEKMPVHCTAKAVVEATKKLFLEPGFELRNLKPIIIKRLVSWRTLFGC